MAYGFSLIQDSKSTWHEYFLKGLLIAGLLSGVAQWVLLETKLKNTWLWIVINSFGIPSGLILGHYLFATLVSLAFTIMRKEIMTEGWIDLAYPLVVISIAGIVLGIFQWLVLKNKVEFAYWWIPVSAVSWIIGICLPYVIFYSLDTAIWGDSWGISGAVFGIMLGGIVGTIGSVAIGKMLANPKHLIKQVEFPPIGDAS